MSERESSRGTEERIPTRLSLLLGVLLVSVALAGCTGTFGDMVGQQLPYVFGSGAPSMLAFMPLPITISLQDMGVILSSLGNYLGARFFDFLDIFEVGLGFGLGLGVEVSVLVGFVGLEGGKYTWFGIFGMGQIGEALDDGHYVIGFPFSIFTAFSALFGDGAGPGAGLFGRLFAFVFYLLGYENGIGGPNSRFTQSGGYFSIGPFGYSVATGTRWTSGSGAVGASVSLGPIAAMARVRAGAIINFVTGFFGWHPFQQPYRAIAMSS